MEVELPRDPAILRRVAAILERAGAWPELATVVAAQLTLAPASARLCAHLYAVRMRAGDEAGARDALAAFVAQAGGERRQVSALARLLSADASPDAVARLGDQWLHWLDENQGPSPDLRWRTAQVGAARMAGDEAGARARIDAFVREVDGMPSRVKAFGRLLERGGDADGMPMALTALARWLDERVRRQPGAIQPALRRYQAQAEAGAVDVADAGLAEAVRAMARTPGQLSRLWPALARAGIGQAAAPAVRGLLDSPADAEVAALTLAEAVCNGPRSGTLRDALLPPLLAAEGGRLASAWTEALIGDGGAGSQRRTRAWHCVLSLLLDRDEAGVADAAIGQLARRADGAGMAGYIAGLRGAESLMRVFDSLRRCEAGGQDTLALQLRVLGALEALGHHAQADRLEAELAGRIESEGALDAPSPTASTVMFRNPPLLAALVATIGWLASRRAPVKVHVAACSTGEEAYSLALALEGAGLLDRCQLSASDVDQQLVRRARTGVIDKAAFLAVPEAMQARFEPRRDGRYALARELLSRIAFSVRDLLRPAGLGTGYDLLVANNVLVHFPAGERQRMLAAATAAVADDGVLCVGGGRHDDLERTMAELALVPIVAGSAEIFDAWRIQRGAWYASPRRYWALPPARATADAPWKHAALLARDPDTAGALAPVVAAAVEGCGQKPRALAGG